ncbi:juvenile hormone esterase-like [Lutzomyia longipalpis]|uniref:juvenile hormone esterase-like n=1 Tax=Lutzomyia longipalpis TaxID=7200 RepID=UPI0024833A23|nr:juvenile hormone esterase-like [Lutzomyia longipalpis]
MISHGRRMIISPQQNSPEVCTKAGCIRGTVESGRKKGYEAFTGVPYAEPPIGNLRFENPVPHRGWSGYWNATYPRDDCLQRNVFLTYKPIVGSEDCLYLNVYRPLERKRKLPVIVYIHGGCFIAFSSKPGFFGPEYLIDTGEVILVTMNYRLGMFGFLCSGDGAVKGNFGLKDQQLALKWVASNIEAFGGDPDSITLAGQSVGAISTQYHMMNPVSQDLFHRAVVISGSIDAFWSFGDDEEDNFRLSSKYAGLKNWNTASSLELANELKKLDAMSLVLALDELFLFDLTPFVPLRPCMEAANQYLHYTDTTKNPIYIYEFGFTGRDTVVKYLSGKDINVGVSHLDDMIYLFTMKDLFLPLKPDTPEGKMSDVFLKNLLLPIVK